MVNILGTIQSLLQDLYGQLFEVFMGKKIR